MVALFVALLTLPQGDPARGPQLPPVVAPIVAVIAEAVEPEAVVKPEVMASELLAKTASAAPRTFDPEALPERESRLLTERPQGAGAQGDGNGTRGIRLGHG